RGRRPPEIAPARSLGYATRRKRTHSCPFFPCSKHSISVSMVNQCMVGESVSGVRGMAAVIGRRRGATLGGVLIGVVCLASAVRSEASLAPDQLGAAIRVIVEAGQQPLLHRPDFSTQQDSLRKLYDAANFRPLWLRGDQPTSQAAEVLRALSE